MTKYIHQFGNWVEKEKSFFFFTCIVLGFFGLMLAVETGNGRFESNDFRVFYLATKSLWNNESVYGVSFGLSAGFFKYAPVILLLYTPALLFGFYIASLLHYAVSVFALLLVFYRLFHFLEKQFPFHRKRRLYFFILVFASGIGHFIRDFHMGNTNVILLAMGLIALHGIVQKKYFLAGFLLAIMILTKPYLAVLILPIVFVQNWRVFWSALVSGLGLFSLSILVIGFTKGLQLYKDWFLSMAAHSDYLTSDNTFLHFFGKITNTAPMNRIGIVLYGFFSVLLYLLFLVNKTKNVQNNVKQMALFFFTLLAIFPNFLVTDTQHFLFSTPMIVLLAVQLYEKGWTWKWFIYVPLILFYLGETRILVGNSIAETIKVYGGIGWANLILVGWAFYLSFEKKKDQINSEND